MVANISVFIKITFILLLLTSGITDLQAQTNPADSLRRVFNVYRIPDEIQQEWLKGLEKAGNGLTTAQLKPILQKIDNQFKSYLRAERKRRLVAEAAKKKEEKPRPAPVPVIPEKEETSSSPPPAPPNPKPAPPLPPQLSQREILQLVENAAADRDAGNYTAAISRLKKASTALEQIGQWKKWVTVQEEMADLYATQGNFKRALEILPTVKKKMRELQDGAGLQRVDRKMANVRKRLNIQETEVEDPSALPSTKRTPTPVTPTQAPPPIKITTAEIKKREKILAQQEAAVASVRQEMDNVEEELEKARENKDFSAIASLNQKIEALEQKRIKDEMAVEKAKNDLINQKLLLAEKEAEINQQKLSQRNLYGGLGLLGIITFSIFSLYRSKRKDHKKLSAAYEELEAAQEELQTAQAKIKTLLSQQVSGAVANELLASPDGAGKKERRFVCVMFLDIRNFTPFVESKTPEEIIEYQNKVLGFMMEKVIEHGGIVNTVLGDGFMATFGAPVSAGNDCLQAYKAAVEIMQMVRQKSNSGEIPATKIGIGMHAGNVVAGNVGTKNRKQYLVTGNTVIIASRLEQLNKTYGSTLIISKEVVEQLPKAMALPKVFDQVMVKGRSKPVQIAKFG